MTDNQRLWHWRTLCAAQRGTGLHGLKVIVLIVSISDFLIRMRISSQIFEIDLALYFGQIGKPHRKNFHF